MSPSKAASAGEKWTPRAIGSRSLAHRRDAREQQRRIRLRTAAIKAYLLSLGMAHTLLMARLIVDTTLLLAASFPRVFNLKGAFSFLRKFGPRAAPPLRYAWLCLATPAARGAHNAHGGGPNLVWPAKVAGRAWRAGRAGRARGLFEFAAATGQQGERG